MSGVEHKRDDAYPGEDEQPGTQGEKAGPKRANPPQQVSGTEPYQHADAGHQVLHDACGRSVRHPTVGVAPQRRGHQRDRERAETDE
jgi:hypothetical protein